VIPISLLYFDSHPVSCVVACLGQQKISLWYNRGGILGRDGCIYNIPASGRHILRIATFGEEHAVQLLGDLPQQADKWQGAGQGLDGSLYFVS
jgi:hypothetical protein